MRPRIWLGEMFIIPTGSFGSLILKIQCRVGCTRVSSSNLSSSGMHGGGFFFCLDLPETRSVARQGFDGACLTQNGFLLIRMCEEANRL
jgi:hypothetical protein